MFEQIRKRLITILGVVLCLYTLVFVNFQVLQQMQSALALFVMFGLVLCFLVYPPHKKLEANRAARAFDAVLAVLVVICFGYVFVQTEPMFEGWWPSTGMFNEPTSLPQRAGDETTFDLVIGVVGLLLVLEATRRSIGWIVPALALLFMAHTFYCHLAYDHNFPMMPDWLLPHQGQNLKQMASSTFLQSLGVLGQAARVMFQYVFLFVVFGAFLEMSGATQFIINFSERVFGGSPGGPAKVSVLGSGLMGSLSGSAVANAVTTGSFTIPMMRNSGFPAHIAGGITAAAASGGALVPPVMGAGAYMMLEFVKRPSTGQVEFLEIARAALLPAILYYLSIFAIVHFYALRVGTRPSQTDKPKPPISAFEAIVFFGALGVLVGLLVMGFSAFKSVTGALTLILVLSAFRPDLKMSAGPRALAIATFVIVAVLHQLTGFYLDSVSLAVKPFIATSWYVAVEGTRSLDARLVFDSILNSLFAGMLGLLVFGLIHASWRPEIVTAFTKAAKAGISLVAASACVGIIIGIVQSTPMANEFGAAIKGVVESSLLLALIGIMACSLVLGMGVPSVVCYLLMATLMGSLLSRMGVDPLAAHMFIFYFGMMSMVTPPVALAAYASASIADARIMPTALASFRFSLVGFTLPFMFVYRPVLLLMQDDGGSLTWADFPRASIAFVSAVLGVLALAGGVTGHFFRGPLALLTRVLACVAAVLLLMPGEYALYLNFGGLALFVTITVMNAVRNAGRPPIEQAA